MSEDFLTRWSRRKRAAEAPVGAPPPKDGAEVPVPSRADAAAGGAEKSDNAPKPADAFDPATLPPIDSITALTDIRDFLRAGVPAELTRAALRRVWSTDPAIRDFVGLAENSWDFTDPNAIPGFGNLESTDEIRQLVGQIIGKTGDAADLTSSRAADAPAKLADSSCEIEEECPGNQQAAPQQASEPAAAIATQDGSTGASHDDIALQHGTRGDDSTRAPLPRTRGRALPQ